MGFTKAQQAVIDARNSNVLVSAAAGSGKTTVLVERIIQKITENNGIDIDRLLVVTFTKAAAAQMKEKILDAIQKRLLDEPDNAHLQRQETLVHGAQITTIDSFCQYVIRNNFNEINLDPSYRVGDTGEMELLRADVIEEILEEQYEQKNEDFINCTEYFATGNNDKKLESIILQLYDYSMSMPFPEEWLKERGEDYLLSEENFENAFFTVMCKKSVKETLIECTDRLKRALDLANEPDGPYVYAQLLETETANLEEAAGFENLSFDELRSKVLNISFGTLPRKKDDSINADKREEAKNQRDYVKKQIDKLAKNYFTEDKRTILKHMELAAKPVETLAMLAINFKRRFDEKKRERGIIDFGDMEHLALEILVEKKEDRSFEPTTAAMQYRDYYDEVMIDEYQDSNSVQELLLSVVSGEACGRFNRFMVGDVKQSIYKFRLARPEIFMEKMGSYSISDSAPKRKITLHNNFRSRREVLDGVNYIFEQIMGEDLGGVIYDEDAALRTGATYPEPYTPGEYNTELLFVNKSGHNSLDGRELEARMTALRIEELMKNGHVTGKDNELRPVKYSDIVILLRAVSGWDEVYKKALEERGIPAFVESKTGYFSATEVVTILNMLAVLNNPLQDIPLVSVMHSPIGGFTDEELAIIKAADKNIEKKPVDGDSFYDIIQRYKSIDNNKEEIISKIEEFLELIEVLRDKSEYLPIDELLTEILSTTNYYEYCAALPGGEKRIANLNMLIEKACDYQKTSFKGVFHFVRYIEQLSKYQVDYGEAGTLGEQADVVRIMSIHKSKGLEFPIVFISGMSKEFNYMDSNQAVVCDMDLGIGTHAIDLDKRIKYRTLRKSIMDDAMRMDVLGEELRILYVAMTRAKEKLIMTGQIVLSDEEKRPAADLRNALSNFIRFRGREKGEGNMPYLLPYFQRSNSKNYQELVLMSLMRHPDMKKLGDAIGFEIGELSEEDSVPVTSPEDARFPTDFDFKVVNEDELEGEEITTDTESSLRIKNLSALPGEDKIERIKFYEDRFEEEYPYSAYEKLFVKTTVSEIKRAHYQEDDEGAKRLIKEKTDIPVFNAKKDTKLRGAQRGTIYHKIMEILYEGTYEDYEKKAADISAFVKNAETEDRLPENVLESINISDFEKFINSDLGKRMAEALKGGKLHRESPFMMGIPANRLIDEIPENELILVQGIIDVWFEEGDDIVLMDYKTDKVDSGEELIKKYSVQLDYYREALKRITEKKVKERLIYSFTLGETILV